jgi:hypothetical protein
MVSFLNRWEPVTPADPDYLPPDRRLTRIVAERLAWKHALDEARRRAEDSSPPDVPATGRAA